MSFTTKQMKESDAGQPEAAVYEAHWLITRCRCDRTPTGELSPTARKRAEPGGETQKHETHKALTSNKNSADVIPTVLRPPT